MLAARPEVVLIEDDHAGAVAGADYRHAHRPHARDAGPWSAPSRNLSAPTCASPSLASDPRTHARVEGRQTLGIRWVSHILQRLVAALWRDRTPARAGRVYTDRRTALLRALADRGIRAHGASGLNVWIPVSEESATVQALLQTGWAVKAGERYRIASAPAIRVTIATLEPRDAVRFADDLARVITPPRRASGA